MAELPEIVAELRKHYREHGASGAGCPRCELWIAWNGPRGDTRVIDALLARLERRPDLDADLLDAARKIRADWGEGDWTAGDVG